MINKLLGFLLIPCLFLPAGCAQRRAAAGGQAGPFGEIDAYLQAQVDTARANPVPGIAIAIVEGRRLVHARAFGVTSLETRQPLRPDHTFHIASISKTFAAAAVVQLMERGKLRLDEPLVTYLPYFSMADARYRRITLRQILNHTSGMPDVEDYEWREAVADDGAAERLTRSLAGKQLIDTPGTAFHYSNLAYDVLADVVARVSGKPFEQYVKDNVLAPLQMNESSFLLSEITPALRTSPHVGIPPAVSPVYPYNRMHAASSTLNANVIDLSHWIIAHLNGGEYRGQRVLSAENVALMHTPSFIIDAAAGRAVGLSWFTGVSQGVKHLLHNGADDGYVSTLYLVPERKFGFVILFNSDEVNSHAINNEVLNRLLRHYAPDGKAKRD